LHTRLREILEHTVKLLEDDPRILGCWLSGSAGGVSEDEFSDVDPIFLVRDEDFDQVDNDLPGLFRSACPNVILWWPEITNSDIVKNYAILIDGDPLVQYDVNILRASAFSPGWLAGCEPGQILFDKTGVLRAALPRASYPPYTPDRLLLSIQRFWLYVYINVKYLKRGDLFKLLFVQRVLFETHLEILRALRPQANWGWWPLAVKCVLGRDRQSAMLRYFGAVDRDSILRAVDAETEMFAQDAREACRRHGVEYPDALEARIRDYVQANRPGVRPADSSFGRPKKP